MLLQTARPATVTLHFVSLYVQSLAPPASSNPEAGRFKRTLPGEAGCTVVAARRVRRGGTVRLKKLGPVLQR